MNTIKKLSSNGFLIESGWVTCDLSLIKSKSFKFPFESLKVGDKIDNLKFKTTINKNGVNKYFLTDFIVINSANDSEASKVKPSYNVSKALNSSNCIAPSDIRRNELLTPSDKKKDGQMYGLALKLAFNNLNSQSVNLDFKDSKGNYVNIILGFDLADIIYDELIKRSWNYEKRINNK